MIDKKFFGDNEVIEKDKEDFINYSLDKGYNLFDIIDFMDYYQNLKTFEYNLKELKGGLKE